MIRMTTSKTMMMVVVEILIFDAPPASAWSTDFACAATCASVHGGHRLFRLAQVDAHATCHVLHLCMIQNPENGFPVGRHRVAMLLQRRVEGGR